MQDWLPETHLARYIANVVESLDLTTIERAYAGRGSDAYDPQGRLIYEEDPSGNTETYVWMDGKLLARIDNGSTVYYIHTDALGTVHAMTDASGNVVWRAHYTPFGQAIIVTQTITNNIRQPGQYYDQETGLAYNLNRDYDATLGRYVEADPLGLAAGNNLYGYVNGNPLSGIDPLGLDTLQIGLSGTTTGGVLGGLAGFGVAIDTQGNIALYSYGGGGGGAGANEGYGISVQTSNAQTVNDLSGPFINTSASGGLVAGGTADTFYGNSPQGPVTGGGVTLGEDVGASALIGGTYTWISSSINPIQWIKNFLGLSNSSPKCSN